MARAPEKDDARLSYNVPENVPYCGAAESTLAVAASLPVLPTASAVAMSIVVTPSGSCRDWLSMNGWLSVWPVAGRPASHHGRGPTLQPVPLIAPPHPVGPRRELNVTLLIPSERSSARALIAASVASGLRHPLLVDGALTPETVGGSLSLR
jgi:hypothetical protein